MEHAGGASKRRSASTSPAAAKLSGSLLASDDHELHRPAPCAEWRAVSSTRIDAHPTRPFGECPELAFAAERQGFCGDGLSIDFRGHLAVQRSCYSSAARQPAPADTPTPT